MGECFLDFIFFTIRVRPFVSLVGRATVFSNSLKLEKKTMRRHLFFETIKSIFFINAIRPFSRMFYVKICK